jgi:hypothetical protein
VSDQANAAEVEALQTAERLRERQRALGPAYWQDEEVRALQATLRRLLGEMGGWSPDGPPLHRRARRLAEIERRVAPLLWPGHGGGTQ